MKKAQREDEERASSELAALPRFPPLAWKRLPAQTEP